MAILLDLANELLLPILDYLPPIEMVSLAMSCKRINTLAQDNLTLHQQRIKKYQNVTLWGCFRHQDQAHPIFLLQDICNDWRVAYYARSLAIECWGREASDLRPFWNNHWQRASNRLQDIKMIKSVLPEITIPVRKMLSMAFRWDEAKVNEVLKITEQGARGAILGLLLVSVPAIRSISFKRYTWHDKLWIDSLKSIIDQQNIHSGSPKASILMDVSELNIEDHKEGRLAGMYCNIIPFVTLPSLRVIRGTSVEDYSFDNCQPADKHELPPSSVTEIALQSTNLPASHLDNVLGYVQVLKQFRYDRRPQSGHDRGAEPGRFTKALLECASHSLESFALTGATARRSNGDEDIKGSLRDFKVLKEIELPSNAFFMSTTKGYCTSLPTKDIPRFVDILPASIETVMLEGGMMWANLAALLIGMPEDKARCLPKLKEILFTLERDQKKPQKQAEARAHLYRKQEMVLQVDQANGDARRYPGRIIF